MSEHPARPERISRSAARLSILCPPYQDLLSVKNLDAFEAIPRMARGAAVVWELRRGDWGSSFQMVRRRPPGVALIMILPPAESVQAVKLLLEATEQCRPHSVLPYHSHPSPTDLTAVLKRVPEDLAVEFMDYLSWRGLNVDLDTRRIVRKIVDLSAEVRSVRSAARALYMSRRALGRRFRSRGLPVPSHLLHFARILRASLALQGSSRTLVEVACGMGYPDGFALSNQMMRLVGVRPTQVRKRAGWEWILEAWLRREAGAGKILLSRGPGARRRSLEEARDLRDGFGSQPKWRRVPAVAETPRP